jgi:signal peptidase II
MRAALVTIIIVAVVGLDELTKRWIAATFLPGESRILIPHVLYLTYVQNYHGAFGLFGSHPLLLAGVASVVLASFYLWYRRENASTIVHVAFALIFGGAIGNIVDRLRFGYVRDFLDLRVWPVFNVADSAITIGVCLLLLHMLVAERRHTGQPAGPQAGSLSADGREVTNPPVTAASADGVVFGTQDPNPHEDPASAGRAPHGQSGGSNPA